MKSPTRLLLSAAFALLAVSSAHAQVIDYIIVAKEQYFTQLTNTTANFPTGNNFRFEASVEGTGLAGITAPTLNAIAGGSGPTGALALDPDDSNRWILQQNFATGGLLESAYASHDTNTYDMTVQGVNLSLLLPAAAETPRFTAVPLATLSSGNIVGGVLTWNVNQSLTISLADPGIAGTAAIDHASLSIWGTNVQLEASAFSNGTLSLTVPGTAGVNNTFIAGQDYHVEMNFINIAGGSLPTTISGGALDGAAYGGVYGRSVSFTLSAIPEPSTYAAFAGLGALGLVIWQRRRAAA